MSDQFECGCERGDNCTKTTMCHVQTAIEMTREAGADALEQLTKDNEDLQYANDFCGKRIARLEAVAHEARKVVELESLRKQGHEFPALKHALASAGGSEPKGKTITISADCGFSAETVEDTNNG